MILEINIVLSELTKEEAYSFANKVKDALDKVAISAFLVVLVVTVDFVLKERQHPLTTPEK